MEASALQAPAAITRSRLAIGSPLLRLRSDEQLVALFRGGNEEAFRIIHDRYRQRLFAYARQMLPGSRHDAEDALQDIFVRAYAGLRASDRHLALRPWLYRVAHNRCIDELRRPPQPPPELMQMVRPPPHDPIAVAERRESLRRLIEDVRRLPDQQRSALLMRELGGMAYADIAAALGVSVAAVKSLLVRARIGLAQATEARDTACCEIRESLSRAHDRGVRPSGMSRRHLRECTGCREFRSQMRSASRQLAALAPLGSLGVLAKLLGGGGGAAGRGAAGGGAAGSGAAAGGVAGTSGAVASIGVVTSSAATHAATIIAAAVVTAGGAVEIQRTIASSPHRAEVQAELGKANGSARSSPSSFTGAAQPGVGTAAGQPALGPPRPAPHAAARRLAAAAAAAGTGGPAIPAVDLLNPSAATTDASSGASPTSGPAGSAGAPPGAVPPTIGSTTPGTSQPGATGTPDGTSSGADGSSVLLRGPGTQGSDVGASPAGATAGSPADPGATGAPGTGTAGTGTAKQPDTPSAPRAVPVAVVSSTGSGGALLTGKRIVRLRRQAAAPRPASPDHR